MLPARHAEMELVRQRLLEEYLVFCQQLKFIAPDPHYFTLLSNRFTEKPVQRGYFMDLIYRYIETESGEPIALPALIKTTVLPFIAEALMTVMYYDNQILDRKAGVVTAEKRNHNLLQSKILLSELYHYIEYKVGDELLAYKMTKLVREVYEWVCIGQEIEIKYNHYEAWKENRFDITGYRNLPFNEAALEQIRASIEEEVQLPADKQAFIDAYSRRIYLTNACLFAHFTKFLTDHSRLGDNQRQDLFDFAGLTGIVFQMVNDIADLVPEALNTGTKTKFGSDAFSDFKNRNITLPIALHLCSNKAGSYAYIMLDSIRLSNTHRQLDDYKLCREMHHSESISMAKYIAKTIAKNISLLLNRQNKQFYLVRDCLDMARNNWFYKSLEEVSQYLEPMSKNKTNHGVRVIMNDKIRHRMKTLAVTVKGRSYKAEQIVNEYKIHNQ